MAQLAAEERLRAPKRRRMYPIREAYAIDREFRNCLSSVPAVTPRSGQDVLELLAQRCEHRMPMGRDAALELAAQNPCWNSFVAECVVPTEYEDSYFLNSLTRLLLLMSPAFSDYESETEMVIDLRRSFDLLEFAVNGGVCHWNSRSATMEANRPTYIAAHCAGIPVMQGVVELSSRWVKGISGRDPELSNVEKTPWTAWEDCYGNAALFLGFAVLGGPGDLTVKLGCLVRSTQSFEVVETLNLHNEVGRVKLLRSLVVLIPVINGIKDCIQHRGSGRGREVVEDMRSVGGSLVLEMTKEIIGIKKETAFMKSWTFGNENYAANFHGRLRSVLDALRGIEGFLREHSSAPRIKLHVTSENDCRVCCVFAPYCHELPCVLTAAMVTAWISQLCDRVEHLHSCNIIHNDIGPQNVLLSAKYVAGQPLPTLYLIDYDECAVVSDTTRAPGLRLNLTNHAPNTPQPHGPEVDVWGVCHTLCEWAEDMSDEEREMRERLIKFGAALLAAYNTTTLNDIREAVAKTCSLTV
jgi:hypothetical protein